MGWFILATILGFVAHWAWFSLGSGRRRQVGLTVAAIAGVAIMVIVPALLAQAVPKDVYPQADWVENRTFTRVLLGLVLGVGAGNIWSLRAAHGDRANNARRVTADDLAQSPIGDHKIWLAVWLPLAASIVLLAMVGPHIDNWLSQLSGFKTSIIEIQLTSLSSTSKAVKPVQRTGFVRDVALKVLTELDEQIELDADFIKQFQLKDIGERRTHQNSAELADEEVDLNAQLKQLEGLKPLFKFVISPAARCFALALDAGFSVERARNQVRELADKLTQLVLLEREEARNPKSVEGGRVYNLHKKVIELVGAAAEDAKDFVNPQYEDRCRFVSHQPLNINFPSLAEHDLIPHLDVARALLLAFTNHDNLAIKVLNEASQKKFKDFNTPLFRATLMFFRGDGASHYYADYDAMRRRSQNRVEIMDRVNRKRGINDHEILTDKLKKRAELADLFANNNIAYGIAVDIAEGQSAAMDLLPIAEQAVETLKKAPGNLEDPSVLDTIGFTTIVAEAHKGKTATLDKVKIRDAMGLLMRAAAREQRALEAKSSKGDNPDYSDLRTIRDHISSARGLLD